VTVAFVLGGGGVLGAHEVGMLRALGEAGIRPDLVVGTSVGAINGAFVAADPDGAAERLAGLWQGEALRQAFSETILGRALAAGATTAYVLHVGRIERPLTVPRRPWEVGLVAFEIARRHRFHEEIAAVPDGVRVHVLPSGGDRRPPDLAQLRYRDRTKVAVSIERAYAASAAYLARLTGS
jgi:hypothetical protein